MSAKTFVLWQGSLFPNVNVQHIGQYGKSLLNYVSLNISKTTKKWAI